MSLREICFTWLVAFGDEDFVSSRERVCRKMMSLLERGTVLASGSIFVAVF